MRMSANKMSERRLAELNKKNLNRTTPGGYF